MRTTNAPSRNKRKKRIFKAAKGNVGARGNCLRTASETVIRSGAFSYRDRKVRAREFRRLWITRLNAACRMRGRRYSEFIAALHEVGIGLDRKSLSEMAIHDAAAFDVVFAQCEKVMKKKDDDRKAREAKEAKAREAAASA
jgi:large subunit ribosomal protein L20